LPGLSGIGLVGMTMAAALLLSIRMALSFRLMNCGNWGLLNDEYFKYIATILFICFCVCWDRCLFASSRYWFIVREK
jgi:Trk-type K+ transport system membrane component